MTLVLCKKKKKLHGARTLVEIKNLSYFRQLEAVVRIAESLAKMKLQAVAGEEEVDEALRLFQVSTLDAALSGNLSGVC